jgi:hypothetical protein
MRAKGSVWFARRDRIARHWLERFGRDVKPWGAPQ